MLVSELEVKLVQAQSEGRQPFLVVATAGTTILGAFDDINDIADVCDRHSVWLHVDVRPLATSCNNFTCCIGSRPSDHYFRSVCLSVCLCGVFLSRF